MTNQLLLSISFLFVWGYTFAQVEDFDDEHIESSLTNFSRLHSNVEYYRFNENEHAFYFLVNGNIEFGNSDYLNIELISAAYVKEEELGFTLGDFNISYTKNFYSKHFQDAGFQGFSPSIKLIVPTGNASYSGLFGYWILEPAVFYSWLLPNEKFFISNRWRLFLPIIDVRGTTEPPKFIRFEPRVGFENKKFWISVTFDNRYIYNQEEFVIFCRADTGFKINENSGISAFYTKRIYNTVLFDTYTSIGYYYIF